ncbi:hypothetical protein SDC9_118267 [bioreactor metagenome]|uniref:Uncharacterized protein n=1 Tax=bioreactor metagenome TaxID=1076179 RepID=A0A645C7I9_9ZZZZ
MLQPVRCHGREAGHRVVPRGQKSGDQMGQHNVRQPVAVGQLVNPLALGLHRVKPAYRSHVGHTTEKALLHRARDRCLGPSLQLPGKDALGPLCKPLLESGGNQQRALVLLNLGHRRQTAAGSAAAAFVFLNQLQRLLPQGQQVTRAIVAFQIDKVLHHARQLRLHQMRRRAVNHGGLLFRD